MYYPSDVCVGDYSTGVKYVPFPSRMIHDSFKPQVTSKSVYTGTITRHDALSGRNRKTGGQTSPTQSFKWRVRPAENFSVPHVGHRPE